MHRRVDPRRMPIVRYTAIHLESPHSSPYSSKILEINVFLLIEVSNNVSIFFLLF